MQGHPHNVKSHAEHNIMLHNVQGKPKSRDIT